MALICYAIPESDPDRYAWIEQLLKAALTSTPCPHVTVCRVTITEAAHTTLDVLVLFSETDVARAAASKPPILARIVLLPAGLFDLHTVRERVLPTSS